MEWISRSQNHKADKNLENCKKRIITLAVIPNIIYTIVRVSDCRGQKRFPKIGGLRQDAKDLGLAKMKFL